MSKYFYCKKWSIGYKEAIDVIAEEKANKLHTSFDPYTVLVDSITSPSCFVEIIPSHNFIAVVFLDEALRPYLEYHFNILTNNIIFLSMAVYRIFSDDVEKVKEGTTYIFNEDGLFITKKETFSPHFLEESSRNIDVSGNYGNVPKFGDYSELTKKER